MPTGAHLVAFAVTAAVLIAIPGPSVLFTVGRALTIGRRAALLNVLGNASGVLAQAVAVALGLGAIVASSATAYTVVKLVGAAYIVFLGLQAIRHRKAVSSVLDVPTTARVRTVLRDGFIVGATNPKTAIFFVAATPQFVDPGRGAVPLQIVVLGLLFVGISLVLDSIWALSASAARTWFARSPRRLARINAGGGGLIIGLGIHVALSGRPD